MGDDQPTPRTYAQSYALILLCDDVITLDALEAWIVESYRAVAPKRLVATLDATSTLPDPAAPDTSPSPG